MKVYYNEWDSYAAAWLRNLIKAGLIPAGDVDERSIVDVRADDLAGYDQCHFFAGIAGWPFAIKLAGWPDDQEVWTGSCPCQPFSCAGQRKGHVDERHLWPAFHRLIAERQPATVFGEQVSGKDGLEWLSAVRADLEGIGYAVGAADLCAASVSSPQVRQRIFWMAYARDSRFSRSIEQWDVICSVESEASAEHGYGGISSWLFDCTNPDSIGAVDGLWRPVGQVRAYGNAIVPQVAAEFIKASLEVLP